MIHPDHINSSSQVLLEPEVEFKTLRRLYERELKGSIYILPFTSLFVVWFAWPLRQNTGAVALVLFIVIAILGLSYWQFNKLKRKDHERKLDESDQSYVNRFENLINQRKNNLIKLNLSIVFLILIAMNTLQNMEVSQSLLQLLGESWMNILGTSLSCCIVFALANYITNGFRFSDFEEGISRIRSTIKPN